ncbi:MAG: LacI family DNA-binding transcriptional regulator [Pyrinomonadaceae bacterium]
MSNLDKKAEPNGRGISLKQLAEHIGLSPGTISVVLNKTPRAASIPQETKDRIFEAAKTYNYRPHYFARSLRANQSFTIGVMVSELTGGYCAIVLNGIESALTKQGYFYLATSHYHRDDLLEHNPQMLIERQVDGIIAVDSQIRFESDSPVVSVAGHEQIKGVTNVVLNHDSAAELGVGHLYDLGHRKIAFIKGQHFSNDTAVRWDTIVEAARKRGIIVEGDLTAQLEGDIGTPEIGYIAAKKVLARGKLFTALFAFNDISAIGAIRALQEAGLRVPEDVSVLGFDDIYAAEFHNPALTTIRQPLFEMGELAGQTLLKAISKKNNGDEIPQTLTVEPELVVRNSTAIALNLIVRQP